LSQKLQGKGRAVSHLWATVRYNMAICKKFCIEIMFSSKAKESANYESPHVLGKATSQTNSQPHERISSKGVAFNRPLETEFRCLCLSLGHSERGLYNQLLHWWQILTVQQKYSTNANYCKHTKHNETLVLSPLTTAGQKTRRIYATAHIQHMATTACKVGERPDDDVCVLVRGAIKNGLECRKGTMLLIG